MKTLLLILLIPALLGAQPAPAIGDSVRYESTDWLVIFEPGEPLFPVDDPYFKDRAAAKIIHYDLRRGLVSWLLPGWAHQDSVQAEDPMLRLQKSFVQIDEAAKTTGLVLCRNSGAQIETRVDIPAADVTRIEPQE